jgi:hypothetical protein
VVYFRNELHFKYYSDELRTSADKVVTFLQFTETSPCRLNYITPYEISGSHGASMKFRVFWDVGRVVTLKLTDVSEVSTDFIALMTEAIRISETSVNFNVTTWQYIPGDSKLHTSHIYYHL